MTTQLVYSYNNKGIYNGECVSRLSPFDNITYIMPENSTTIIPTIQEGMLNRFDGFTWNLEATPYGNYYKKISDNSIKFLDIPDLELYILATEQEIIDYELVLLKEEKMSILKKDRDLYKKTIIIKDNITLFDLRVGTNHYENMYGLLYGWTQIEQDLFNSELSILVARYDVLKSQIKNSVNKTDLNNIVIII